MAHVALDQLGSKRNDAYEAAVAALPEDNEVHLDRKLERGLAMLIKLKELRRGTAEG